MDSELGCLVDGLPLVLGTKNITMSEEFWANADQTVYFSLYFIKGDFACPCPNPSVMGRRE